MQEPIFRDISPVPIVEMLALLATDEESWDNVTDAPSKYVYFSKDGKERPSKGPPMLKLGGGKVTNQ